MRHSAIQHAASGFAWLVGHSDPILRCSLHPASFVTDSPASVRYSLLDAAFDATSSLLVALSADGRVLTANRAAIACAQCAYSEMEGRPYWETPGLQRHPDVAHWLMETVAHAHYEARSRRDSALTQAGGTTTWFDLSISPIEVVDGDSPVLLLEGRDVSERVAVAQSLAAREGRVRLLTDSMTELVFLMRVEAPGVFRCESVNPAYLALTGLREEQVVGRVLDEMLPSAAADAGRLRYEQVLRDGEPMTYREDVHMTAGRVVVETRLTPVRAASGEITHLLGLARDVTSDVLATAAVEAAEARFRAVLDAGLDAFVIVDAMRNADGSIREFNIVDANARAINMAAERVAELRGTSLLDAFPHSRESGLWEHLETVLDTRQPLEVTQYAPIPSLPGRWVLRQLVPIGDGVAISSRDITSRHMERMALEASEARHRQLFESNGAIQVLADVENACILDVNPAAEAFYGWPREAMRTMLAIDLDSSTLAEWREAGASLAGGAGRRQLRAHRVAGQEHREVDLFTSLVRIGDRTVVHMIVQDISDRVRAEARLRESETRFDAVVGSMHEGVVVHDAQGAIRAFNPSAVRILGLSGAQLLGIEPMSEHWRATREDGTRWPPDTHPAIIALRTGAQQPRAVMGLRSEAGEQRWLSVTAAPLIRPGEASPYGSVAVFSDITDERLADDRMRQSRTLEAVGQLAGGIAHDFNNLLTVIRGAAGFIGESIAAGSPLLEDVHAIERATERAEALTRQLLAVGRRQLLHRSRLDLNEFVRENLDALRAKVPANVTVLHESTSTVAVALLDRTRIDDALRVLVENALEAMPDGGTLALGTEVALRVREANGEKESVEHPYAVLRVTDSGVGMRAEVKARLFEPFFSTQPFGTGRGMDLASVNGMVEQSLGFIEYESAPGQGTTLRLFFPQATPVRGSSVAPVEQTLAIVPRQLLLVDDDMLMRNLVRKMLQRMGHAVITAESGAEALRLLDEQHEAFDVLLTDLTMPGMSGMELIDELRHRTLAMPVVAMSGFALDSRIRELLAARAIPFVAKPFTVEELELEIERALRQNARPSTP